MPAKCQTCDSDRIIRIQGKTSDLFDATYQGDDYQGYVLTTIGITDDTSGDYIGFKYCLQCGQIQGKFPRKDPELT